MNEEEINRYISKNMEIRITKSRGSYGEDDRIEVSLYLEGKMISEDSVSLDKAQ